MIIVPPAQLEALITHELVHVFMNECREKWLEEGIACFAAGDTNFLYASNADGFQAAPLDESVKEADGYARGWAFVEWLLDKQGPVKVREFAGLVSAGVPFREAAPAVIRQTWEQIVREEHPWSVGFLARFNPRR